MLPRSFLERMERMLGDEYDAFLEAFEQERYQALRLNVLKRGLKGRSAADLPGKQKEPGIMAAGGIKTGLFGLGFAHLTGVPWAENGYYYASSDQPGKHPYHEAGVYYIQEPSAMAPVELLKVQPGERVLDLCAAPGGKSTQIAAKLGGEGFLLCNEINAGRAKILSGNVERMGIINAWVTNETPAHLAEVFPEYFDRVLVDAPCSGEGMFRKNEAACEEWSPENVALCARRQDEILDCAAKMLRPGGRLVYSTCTFAPAENEGSVSRFLGRQPEFSLLPIEKEVYGAAGCDGSAGYLESGGRHWPEASGSDERQRSKTWNGETRQQSEDWKDDIRQQPGDTKGDEYPKTEDSGKWPQLSRLEHTLRLWPHKVRGEGHFAAVLEKAGELPEGYRNPSLNGNMTCVSEKELGEYFLFCQETFGSRELPVGQDRKASYLKFGDNLYLVSPQMPSVRGLKVLRPGLHVGTLKKNRFEPSHALALALSPDGVRHVWNMDFEKGLDPEEDLNSEESRSFRKGIVTAYLNGQAFPAEGEKGWYLICVDGFSIGWGKLAGGMMKNHYPKGLRK